MQDGTIVKQEGTSYKVPRYALDFGRASPAYSTWAGFAKNEDTVWLWFLGWELLISRKREDCS